MRRAQRNRPAQQQGFTLLEMVLAMAVLAVMLAAAWPLFQSMSDLWGKYETNNRLADIEQAVTTAYEQNMVTAEVPSNTGRELVLPTGTVVQSGPNAAGWCSTTTTANFMPLYQYLKHAPNLIWRDGYGRPVCVLITPQLSLTYDGATIYYHTIAIVSAGRHGKIAAGTNLSDAGVLSLAGDNQAVLINGRLLALAALQSTQAQMAKVVAAYQAYFQNRYLGNTARDTSIDYFSNAWGDTGAPIYGSTGTPLNGRADLMPALGLSTTDITDGWGQVMTLDNASDAVRSPNNSNAAMTTPPYTARISTTLPGGQTYAQTVMGSY